MLVVCQVDPLKIRLNNYVYKYDSPREIKSVLLPLFEWYVISCEYYGGIAQPNKSVISIEKRERNGLQAVYSAFVSMGIGLAKGQFSLGSFRSSTSFRVSLGLCNFFLSYLHHEASSQPMLLSEFSAVSSPTSSPNSSRMRKGGQETAGKDRGALGVSEYMYRNTAKI